MKFGICLLSIVPVRANPSEKAEMSTQLLFGELYTILESDLSQKWIRIKIVLDGYEGWISANQSYSLTEDDYNLELHTLDTYYIKNSIDFIKTNNSTLFVVVAGSVFHSFPVHKEMMIVGNTSFNIENESISDPFASPSNRDELIQFSFRYFNSPYLWGGKTPFGIDCSGFVQQVFRLNGYALSRDAWQQANEGEEISIDKAQPGDLAFFKNEEEKITHVGIILKENKIIHASGFVRIDLLDEKGIYRKEENIHSHQLAFIKKIIP